MDGLRKHPFLLALRRWGRFDEERGETDVFAGYDQEVRGSSLAFRVFLAQETLLHFVSVHPSVYMGIGYILFGGNPAMD